MAEVGTDQFDSSLQTQVSMFRDNDLRMGTPTAPPKGAPVNPSRPAKISVLDNAMRVKTPENISFEYRLAGPCRRLIAYVLDVLITIAGFTALTIVVYLLCLFAILPLAQLMGIGAIAEAIMGVVVGMTLILYFMVYWFYGAWMEANYNGQTLGKRMTGMRVLSADGHSIDGVQAVLRNFFRLLDIFPTVTLATMFDFQDPELAEMGKFYQFPTFLFGLIMMTLSSKFQRVGDMVAGTVVVNEERERLALALSGFSDPRVPQLAELIPNYFVAPNSLANAIASYIERRRFMAPQRASEIASHVAPVLLQQFQLPADTNHDLFLCALYYKIFIATGEIERESASSTGSGEDKKPIQKEQRSLNFGSPGPDKTSVDREDSDPNLNSIKEGKE